MADNKKLLALQKDLVSADEKKVIAAIKRVAHDGSPAVIHHLLMATFKSGSAEALEEGKKIYATQWRPKSALFTIQQ